VFWGKQNIADPQSLNSYSYANDNPVTRKDPTGEAASISGIINSIIAILNAIINILSSINSTNYSGGGSSSAGGASMMSKSSGGGGGYSPGYGGGGSVVVPNVIPNSAFVSQWSLDNPGTGCRRACNKMGPSSGQDPIITGMYGSDGKTVVTQPKAKQGIDAINSSLQQGTPVTVGVYMNGPDAGNANAATQHFIKVVGANVDQAGQYYNFFDPGTHSASKGTSPQNRLYVQPDGSLRGASVYNQDTTSYTVTEIDP
jgi:hypothetical protein